MRGTCLIQASTSDEEVQNLKRIFEVTQKFNDTCKNFSDLVVKIVEDEPYTFHMETVMFYRKNKQKIEENSLYSKYMVIEAMQAFDLCHNPMTVYKLLNKSDGDIKLMC